MKQELGFSSRAVSLASAQRVVQAAVDAANQLGAPLAIVVVDRSGQVTNGARMDGASVLAYEVAFKKSWTAAMTGAPTANVHEFVSSDAAAVLCMPHMQNFSVIAGGLPIYEENVCVGAVGVSGATAEVDLKVAEAAVAALRSE